MGETYLYVQTVANRLKLCKQTVYRLIRDGELPAVRIGGRSLRIGESALQQYLEKNVVDPDEEYAMDESAGDGCC